MQMQLGKIVYSRELSPAVKSHLKKVYLTLCCGLLSSAIGAYVHMLLDIGGLVTGLCLSGCILWLGFFTAPTEQPKKRLSLLILALFLQGASDGRIVEFFFGSDGRILIVFFMGAAFPFVCFLAAATLARRREHIYLGGLASSMLAVIMWLHLASLFYGRSFFVVELYVSFLAFVVALVVESENIIDRAIHGDLDVVKHSAIFCIAAVSHLISIMVETAASMKHDRKKKEQSSN